MPYADADPGSTAHHGRLTTRVVKVFGVVLSGLAAFVQGATVEQAINVLDADLGVAVQHPSIAGACVAVVSGDQVMYLQCSGERSAGGEPVDSRTRFRAASLSKGFTGTLAAMLHTQGVLSLDEPVRDDVPYFTLMDESQAQTTTWTHILSHRVGLPHYAYDRLIEANWNPEAVVRRYSQVKPVCNVGECYGYQNVSFNLFAAAVERHLGESFENQVRRRLFIPLGLFRANFGADGLRSDENFAAPHVRKRGIATEVPVRTHYYRLPASAGVNLSIEDLSRWAMAQMGTIDGIAEDVRAQVWAPRTETRREMRASWRARRLKSAHYGLGFRIYDYAGHEVIYHAGAVEGYQSQLAIVPDMDVAIAVMWNSESNKPWGAAPVFLDALFGLGKEDWMKISPP